MNWTEERVELLKKLWADGLSASQIAAELGGGVTRNAVIGKVHRLGLSGRVKAVASAAPRPRKPRAPSHPSATLYRVQGNAALAAVPAPSAEVERMPEVAVRPRLEAVSCERVTIMDLRECMCRWPIGDPGRDDFRFCGTRADPATPYCNYHSAMPYQPTTDRRRRNAA
jgi:GcrA cell cycle regulator